MGYPMTWKRLVNRNGLTDGDYGQPPERHAKRVVTSALEATLADASTTKLARFDSVAARVDEYERAVCSLAGDLRRLERDAVDEQAVCLDIARRTAIDREVVAAVLKEFFDV